MSLEKYKPTPETALTVPNAISITGAALVWHGANNIETSAGVSEIVAGRALDLVDGVVARTLDQQSDFGAAVDAGLDKIGMLKLSIEAYKKQAAPPAFLGSLAIRHSINTIVNTHHALKNPEEPQRPTKAGKISMAMDNLAFIGYLASNVLEKEKGDTQAAKKLKLASNLVAVAGIAIGTVATYQYVKRSTKSKKVIE